MIKRITSSLAFRSAIFYKGLLQIVPRFVRKKPRTNAFKMVTLCGKVHLPLLKESLNSIVINFNKIPTIEIYNDGSIPIVKMEKALKRFAPYITILDWRRCLSILDEGEHLLGTFAKKHPIGRKLLIITTNAKITPTLWWDTDILWFKDIHQLSFPKPTNGFCLQTTEDYQPSYSKNMLANFKEHKEQPYINTGVVYLSGNLFKAADLQDLLIIAAEDPDHFSEQTLLAKANLTCKKLIWPLTQISCLQSDILTLKPTFLHTKWIARHYVGPVRHLFWRDSFFLRLGYKQK